MIGFLIFPVLICGYLYISSWPSERIKISLYHGWSLYIRAAAFGFIIVSLIILAFGIVFPEIGLLIYQETGFSISSSRSIFSLVSSVIEDSRVIRTPGSGASNASVDMVSVSIVSIFATWLILTPVNVVSKSQKKTLQSISKKVGLDGLKTRSIERIFFEKSPIEHQLMVIAGRVQEDLAYNSQMQNLRRKAYIAIKRKHINIRDKKVSNELFSELKYRDITYALITLENDKFYVGLPQIIPEPDEESVKSTSIQILPAVSGYREKKKLRFTTNYDFDLSCPNSYDCISIPRDKILTVSGFSFGTYNRLQRRSKIEAGG